MFWGVTLENGKRYTQVVDTGFHVSMAAMEFNPEDSSKKGKPISVMIEHEKSEFLLCTLQSGVQVQQPLDLNFIEGEEVTFFLNGLGTVHLTGYLMDANDLNDTMEMEPSDSDEDEEFIAASGMKRKSPGEFKQIKKAKTDDLEEDDDDDDEDEDDDEHMMDVFAREAEDSDEESSEEEDSDDDIFMDQSKHSQKTSPQAAKPVTPSSQQRKANIPNIASSPGKQQQAKPDSAKKAAVQEKTPQQKKQQQQQQSAKKTPKQAAMNGLDSSIDASEANQSSKKKKKKKRNKNKEGGDTPTPTTPKSAATTPDANKGKKSQPQTPKSTPRKVSGGTEVTDLTMGSGPVAKKGRFVQITYVGKLKNNQVFDASKKDPLRFRLGQGEVIKGMDLGIEGMQVGGKRKIVIPPQQGYGSKGSGPIPPNSTLIFDVELKAIS